MEFIEKRRKHFATLRAQEKRNRPPTNAQKRNQMSIYLKHMGGYKHNQLKGRSYDEIQKLFDKEMKRVNSFVAMNSEAQEIRDKLESDESKKQKTDENEEVEEDNEAELKSICAAGRKSLCYWITTVRRIATISLNTAREKISTARQKIVLLGCHKSQESKTSRHVKRGRDTKIPQSSGPPVKVGDEAVHKELGDRMERAATTASSLEVEQDSVNAVRHYLVLPVQVPAADAKANTVNGERQLQALVDKKRVIITESSIRSDLHLAYAGGIDCLPTATIFKELAQMRYEKPSQRLTFYKDFFSPQ
ncbi:hypothetical protein Tco_0615790 [Tanacetum coccineum]